MKERKNYKIAALLSRRILFNNISDKESEILSNWRRQSIDNESLYQRLCNETERELIISELDNYDVDEGWKGIEYKLIDYKTPPFYTKQWVKYAATLLLFASISLSIFVITKVYVKDSFDILPLMEGAYISMADGSSINLDMLERDSVIEKGGVVINMHKDSSIINYSESNEILFKKRGDGINRIYTGAGKDYRIILPDGSRIHLNSKTEIVFDFAKNGRERIVEVKGEALFDVAHDQSRPFIVKCGDMTATVLGTIFNIKGYENEDYISATLLYGSLQVAGAGASMVITPNQQATLFYGEKGITVKSVDGDILTSWSKGSFSFKDQRLSEVLKSLQRWYDFQYDFKDAESAQIRMGLSLNRGVSFSQVIEALQNSSIVSVEYKDGKFLFSRIDM